MRRLILVRHGLPDYRSRKRGDVPPGPPLSHIGREQVLRSAAAVRKLEPARIYTSPLARAQQTARILAQGSRAPVVVDQSLREWHRADSLYAMCTRNESWLRRWLRDGDETAAVVGHASPLLAIVRGALYLPHSAWFRGKDPNHLITETADRFEFAMAAVFMVEFDGDAVTARRVFQPEPKILHVHQGRQVSRMPRPADGENTVVRRRHVGPYIGYPPNSGKSE